MMRISSLLCTLATYSSCVIKLTFVGMSLLVAMPLTAQQGNEDRPPKPSWRVLEDAPYLIIPAYPQLKTTGETLKQLGFDSVESLLSGIDKRSYFSSVAFSPNGGLIASSSSDNTFRIWDLQSKTVSLTLLEGNHANWLSIDRQRQVFRGDDGTLLKKRDARNDNLLPVPVASSSVNDKYSISVVPEHITLAPGECKEVRIRVTNSGSHPVYWLHPKPSTSRADAIRFDPPDQLFTGKGRHAWNPARIAKLDPGETATLYARIAFNLKLPANFALPGLRQLELAVVSAGNTQVSQTINVDVQSPNLEWQRSIVKQDGKTLKILLQNRGNATLHDFSLDLYGGEADSAAHVLAQPLAKQTILIKELAPEAVNEAAFVLPDGIDLKFKQLTLQGKTRGLPLFSWKLPAPDIEGTGQLLH
jgi:WD40 repeat protein